jgi:cytochrome c oxidase subunit 2
VRTRVRTSATAVLAGALLAACSGPGNMLDPAGPGAGRIAGLWWYLFALGTAVFVVVLALFAVPLLRRRRGGDVADRPDPADEQRARRWIGGGAVGAFLVLVAVQVVALPLGRDVAPAPADAGEFVIEVDARQFWWHVRYPDADVVTANEIHIPTDTPVRFGITSADVVHTFWIPRLHGKVEVAPGRVLELVLEADEPGVYPGRCTEFCGLAHAQMEVRVVAQEPDDFATWLQGQAAPAADPSTDTARAGLEVFRSSSCVHCHTVRGHAEASDIGPDLTHLASRDTIAAGALPNRRGHLGGWILDPQGNKPGARMPPTQLDGQQVQVLLDYLQSLR